MNVLPNFIIGGAAKCGTTSLDYYLGEHTQFCMARPKETHFFDSDAQYKRGLDFYGKYWAHCNAEPFRGDTTPSYLHGRYIAERILKDLPEVKIIFIFRDPIKRAYSNYWHGLREGRKLGTFEQSIDDPENRFIWERSRYARYLSDYLELFGKDRVLCLLTEQLDAEPEEALKQVYDFLGAQFEIPATVAKRKNTHWMPRSLRIQRLRYKYFHYTSKPEDVSHYDENAKLILRRQEASSRPLRRTLNWLLNKLNTQTMQYPPLAPETAALLRERMSRDYAQFAELTGLNIDRWWGNVNPP